MRAHDGDMFDDELGPAESEPHDDVAHQGDVRAPQELTERVLALLLQHNRVLRLGADAYEREQLEDLPS